MDPPAGREDVVHPEVRAHINSLVSALGGFNDEDDGTYYRLGDDALDVLRDIKKWIRFYDEKTNRMDVARCLADANLVSGDLIHILALWSENGRDDKYKAKVALACFELLAPLTWPIEKNRETMTNNHHRHVPVLELAQLKYKRDIINFDSARLLHTAVRAALPSMALPIGDRTQRDGGIIKLVLYFLRNIALIASTPGMKTEGDESQISRSATIDAFSYQDIFFTILTLASNMGEDFKTEDVIVMEIIFHLIKRVDNKKLFLNEEELRKVKTGELADAMKKEASMLRSYNRKAPTRHSRFGTMLWVQKSDGKVSSLSGQGALADVSARERKMDESKTFRPPRRAAKEAMEPVALGPPVVLNARANKQLRDFVEEFLDSGFNPLFQQVRKTLEREGVEVMSHHPQQFFYTVAWFLETERARQHSKRGQKPSSDEQVSSYQLVATVLNQEMFITVKRFLVKSYSDGNWRELNAVMRCLTQILLTVQEMFSSDNEEDQEIAENALGRLFYEEVTHDTIVNIVRTYKDQGFDYLDACIELVHTYMRVLEAYSKENVDMQVRSKRRTRTKKKKAQQATGADDAEGNDQGDGDDDSADDQAAAEKTSQERKFDFKKFANRFVVQGVVDTFVKYMNYYRDLDDSQLKRAHRYFYRLAFKQDMSVMLFRVDIIHLLYNMIKGPEPLDKTLGMYKEWEELVKQVIRRCMKKIQERPALIIELLFSKTNSTAYYLEHGYDKQVLSTTTPKPAAELEFRRVDLALGEQIAIAVSLLLEKEESDHLEWVKTQLIACEKQREAWEASEKARLLLEAPDGSMALPDNWEVAMKEPEMFIILSDDDARKTAVFKNPRLRLLMKVVGFERLAPALDEELGSAWIIPPRHSAEDLGEYRDLINKAMDNPAIFGDGETADAQVRRKAAPRKKAVYDDDEDDGANDFLDDGDNAMFPKNARWEKVGDAGTKKRRTRRNKDNLDSEDDTNDLTTEERDAVRDRRAHKRRRRDLERQLKIKSALYIDPADDESDPENDAEFFAREEAIRQRVSKALEFAPTDVSQLQERLAPAAAIAETMRRLMADSDDDEQPTATESDGDGDGSPSARPRKRKSEAMDLSDVGAGADETSSPPVKKPKSRLGFLVDSSDEEDEDMDDAESSSDNAGADEEETVENRSPLKEKDSNVSAQNSSKFDDADDGEDDDIPVATKRRPRVKSGFVLEDSDEE
ncbi:essential for circadian rhythmicity [Cryphonectria parasitica EP155]|uniref:Topoisomerase 1-associated factor 1 n=1 Tax=Cryphonectria parasitica (strain ATCC 38755 / EP155) TaxID=660469 RepID=A0A9P5CU25_CRYP1|nr:essential for circadian rhythmicity [Cryphonectria parasitica EP155]KAF3770958.1 essential for circadian rhythmicity [Cryphonectria parasitica EP155]